MQTEPIRNDAMTTKQAAIISVKHQHPTLSTREVGELAGADKSYVSRTLREYGIDTSRVDNYKSVRADILAGIQERVLRAKYGNDDAIKKMPDAAAILLFNSTYNAERLERGQPNEISLNVNVLKKLDDNASELRKTLEMIKCNNINGMDNNTINVEMPDNSHTVNLNNNVSNDKGKPQAERRRRGRPRKA